MSKHTNSIISNNFKKYYTDLLILALPLLIGNLGHTLIGAEDVLVIAKYNINSLAAISIANSIIVTIFIFGLGIICAISIILSNMRGAKHGIKKHLLSTLIFSVITAFIFTILCYSTKYIIPYLGFEQVLIPYIQEYIAIVSFSMFGIFIFEGLKQFMQSYEIVKFPNILMLIAVVINLVFDIVFVFGCGFIPSMGSRGAAIATLSIRTLLGLIMLFYVFRFIDFKSQINFSYMIYLLKIGIPIGIGLFLEVLAFNIITVLVGRETGLLAAAHSILITITNATFMVPLAISTALSVKVAYYFGAKKTEGIKNFSIAGLILGVGFMACMGIILALFPIQIISLFTNDEELLKITVPIVSITAMYQIFDGLQVVSGGILKGFKMTKFVSGAVLFGYWAAGMPAALLFVKKYGLSLRGYWLALAISLCVMGFIQAVTAKNKFNQIKKNL
ncbi:MAG: MATE family efflux transporter [Candidatus Gastranaerophilales bacterium]|nr:MATE family efflux transporter [Candidatus Gastranaerophilales bacterium]